VGAVPHSSLEEQQNRKIFLTFLIARPQNFFSIKETKIFLFCSVATKRRGAAGRGCRAAGAALFKFKNF